MKKNEWIKIWNTRYRISKKKNHTTSDTPI